MNLHHISNGTIEATVTGPRRYSADLVKGGLELPCRYKFTDREDSIKKAHCRLNAEQDGVCEIEGKYYKCMSESALTHVLQLLPILMLLPTNTPHNPDYSY